MEKVLLAIDDPSMMELLKTLLSMEGYQAATLVDKGVDILENIRLQKPDVLLMDNVLRDSDGLEIIRQIRQIPEFNRIRIIMTSGIDRTDEYLASGADGFLIKPYLPNELLNMLRS